MQPGARSSIGRFLLAVLAFNTSAGVSPLVPSARAQDRIIIVNAEQPNLWTLEQAHYLLAQMHRRNLDLRAKRLDDLDANEIAGLRFDLMRMLIEFGATFNQADLEANRLFTADRGFNTERRRQLIAERDELRRESRRLNSEIETLQTEKAGTEDEEAKARLDARIAAKTARRDSLTAEMEQLNTELGTVAAPSGTPTATTGGATFDPARLPQGVLQDAFKEAATGQIERFNQQPRLNASLQLDNFLQMQYEIISKQLSLLRDELGPGERLVFLELPQTVNAAHHESKRKWAQSWWRIAGYTKRVLTSATPVPVTPAPPRPDDNQEPITVTQDMDSILRGQEIRRRVTPKQPPPCALATPSPVPHEDRTAIRITAAPPPPSPTPTPPTITIKDVVGKVSQVTVTFYNLNHPRPDDLDIMLVGPQGQNAVIMSDVGRGHPVRDLTITLDDISTTGRLPDAGPLRSSTYQPWDAEPGADKFLDSAPEPLGGSALSVFNGTDPNGKWSLHFVDDSGAVEGSIAGGWSLNIATDCKPEPTPTPREVAYEDEFVNLDEFTQHGSALWKEYLSKPGANTLLENRSVRAVELIPRQSSLNVNDMNLKVKAGAFNFVLSTLFGFGSRLNVQRQREQFSQFVQQELYSAAFGKGAREFGWTFTPMPGTERLHSGVRTTYAVVVVPDDASSLVLESNGCYFPRSQYPPNNFADTKHLRWNEDGRTSRNCGGTITKTFVVPIPSSEVDGNNDFWIRGLSFQPVAKGKRIVVSVSGKNFSPQMGVLINGQALVQSIGLAQPLIRDDSEAGRITREEFRAAEIQGEFERVDTGRVIFSFRMPPDFQGTPTITLIGSGRAVDLNWLTNITINGRPPGVSLNDFTPKMFGHGPGPDAFRIDRVRVFRSAGGTSLTAEVRGAGFLDAAGKSAVAKQFINGVVETAAAPDSASLMRITFDAPRDETIKVTMVSTKGVTIESDSVPNPAFLSVSEVEVTTFEGPAEGAPATLLVRIRGTGFTDSLRAVVNGQALEVAVKSATEAVFTMPDPQAAAVVTLEDDAGQKAKIVVTRKTKRQE